MASPRRRFRISIHAVILALVLLLVAPGAVFLGVIVRDIERERLAEIARTGELYAAGIADRLEDEFQTLTTMLAVFASSGWLDAGEYEALHQRARTALIGSESYLIVLDEELTQLLNTRVDFGTELGTTPDTETARRVLETGSVVVTDLFKGRVSGAFVFQVLRRTILSDGRRFVLVLTRNAADIELLIPTDGRGKGWNLAIFDGSDHVAYSAIDGNGTGGVIAAECRTGPGGATEPAAAVADESLVFRRDVNFSDWRVCVWAAPDRIETSEPSSTMFFTLISIWFVGAVGAAAALSFLLSRSIANAARVADALDTGKGVPATGSFVTEIDEVLKSLVTATCERLRKDEELRMLLRETAHRAKNQIAITTSLLSLSARRATSVPDLKDDLTERLAALGRSIDMMGGGRVETTPLADLIEVQLTPFLNEQPDLLELDGTSTSISQSAAQSFGLVLHELATNASKYGAWSIPGGMVHIAWRREGDELVFEWTERGAPAEPPASDGFGTSLIDFIVERAFAGTIARHYVSTGFACRITLPIAKVTVIHTAGEAA